MNLITENQNTKRKNILINLLSELGFKSIKAFQKAHGQETIYKLDDDGLFGLKSYAVLYSKLLNVQEFPQFEGNYFKQSFTKRQIVWHHSAGWDNNRTMFSGWISDGIKHVATAIGIQDDGSILRGYDEQFWAYHIGLGNAFLEQGSVAVEICNWGALEERENKLYTWVCDYGKRGRAVTLPYEKAIELNYKGYKYYEIYTDAEIKSLKYWTLLNAMRFDIPLDYSHNDMWAVSSKAMNGVSGIYTHNSYISWKTDVSPQPKLIEMAKALVNYTKGR
jgi:hypothetical protein